jgi:hypothetical protein
MHAGIAVLLANGVFLMLAVWAATLPRPPLAARIEAAFASGELIENDWPWLDARRGFNQYHDCTVLQMVSNPDRQLWASAVAPLIYNRTKGETDRCATLRTLVTGSGAVGAWLSYRYTRYWHGYIPVSAALLRFMDLREVRTLLEVTLYAALLLLIPAAGLQNRRLLAVAISLTLTGVLFWSVRYFGKSLTHGPGDIAVIVGMATLLRWRHALTRPGVLIPFCAVYGAVVTYFEFLTALLPTAAGLLVPLVYLIDRGSEESDGQPRHAWRLALIALAGFGAGAAATVALKQVLALTVVGPEAALSFLEYLHRYVNPSPGASLRHFGNTWSSPDDPLIWSSLKALYLVLTQGYVLTYGSYAAALVLYGAAVAAWAAAGWLAITRRHPHARSDFLGFAAGAAIVTGWALAFQTHTTIHKWWMVRMMLVPVAFGWGALAWQLLTKSAPEHAGSPAPLAT